MPSDFTDDLRLAHVLADDADALSQARFKALDLHVMTKPDQTPVTDADKSVEEGIRRTLSRTRSRDAVVGEETGSTGHSQRRWVPLGVAPRPLLRLLPTAEQGTPTGRADGVWPRT